MLTYVYSSRQMSQLALPPKSSTHPRDSARSTGSAPTTSAAVLWIRWRMPARVETGIFIFFKNGAAVVVGAVGVGGG